MQAGVPRRPQEQHRDEAFGLAVPALLPGWDPGSCADQGIGRGSWPLTLMIGIWVVVSRIPLFSWWILCDLDMNKIGSRHRFFPCGLTFFLKRLFIPQLNSLIIRGFLVYCS